MNFKLYREHGALNSPPVFDAVEKGLRRIGQNIVSHNEDIPVIWSVLFSGRMQRNRQIYFDAISNNKPVLIVEVGNLQRNGYWRLSFNNINRDGEFANDSDLDPDRPKKLGIDLKPLKNNRQSHVLITGQHEKSLQWKGMPPMSKWIEDTIVQVRKYTNREVKIRPHPRCPVNLTKSYKNVSVERPKQIKGTYDSFDITYDCHCVINFNSGCAVQAAIEGTPVITDCSSLAYPVSDKIKNINEIHLPDRTDWLTKLSHSEWTVDEISSGLPFLRLLKVLN